MPRACRPSVAWLTRGAWLKGLPSLLLLKAWWCEDAWPAPKVTETSARARISGAPWGGEGGGVVGGVGEGVGRGRGAAGRPVHGGALDGRIGVAEVALAHFAGQLPFRLEGAAGIVVHRRVECRITAGHMRRMGNVLVLGDHRRQQEQAQDGRSDDQEFEQRLAVLRRAAAGGVVH